MSVVLVSGTAGLVFLVFRETLRNMASRTLSLAGAAGTDRLKGVEDGENIGEVDDAVGGAAVGLAGDVNV